MSTFSTAVLALLWAAVVVRLPTLLRDAPQRAMWATWFSLALCRTAALPAVAAHLHDLVGAPRIVPHLLAIAAAFFLLRFISLVTDRCADRPGAPRNQFVVAAAVALVLITLVALAPAGLSTDGWEPTAEAMPPSAVAYWVVLEAYVGGVLGAATVLFWRLGRAAPRSRLRAGLWCIATGTLLLTAYAAVKATGLLAHAAGIPVSLGGLGAVLDPLRSIGALLGVGGALVPAAHRLRRSLHAYRSLRALHPLWLEMRRAFPEVILFSPRRALFELTGADDVHLRLYRRVIEIRDGMLALRDFLPAGATAEAAAFLAARGVPERDRAALAEACGIELALFHRRHGLPRCAGAGQWASGGAEMPEEVGWLGAVAAARQRPEPDWFVAHWCDRREAGQPAPAVPSAPVPAVGGPSA